MNRRHFLQRTAAATAGLALALPRRSAVHRRARTRRSTSRSSGFEATTRAIATWTARGRGQDHYEHLSGIANVRITHVVDIDERHFNGSLSVVKQKYGGNPTTATDFRRVLDDKDVDAVTIAAPDHWHALMTIWACQAGKDVYVEKPISHNIVEGRRMIDAARRYDRIVEVGTQRRSNAVLAKAVQFLRDGGLGTVYAGKTVVYRPENSHRSRCRQRRARRRSLRSVARTGACRVRSTRTISTITGTGSGTTARPISATPASIPWTPYDGCSESRNIRVTAHCSGGLYEAGDRTDQTTPNTQSATYRYADGTEIHCDLRNWFSGPAEAQGVYIFGSKGWMKVGDDKAEVFFGRKNDPGPTLTAGDSATTTRGRPTSQNFIDCVRSRKSENLKAALEDGHFSTTLCHLGNISYRVGRSVKFDGATRAVRGRRRGRQASRSCLSRAVPASRQDVAARRTRALTL